VPKTRLPLLPLCLASLLALGCGSSIFETDGGAPAGDAGNNDAGASDAGPRDGGANDAGPADAGGNDAGPADAGQDGGPDAGEPDAGPGPDAGAPDAGEPDAGEPDAGAPDAGPGPSDSGVAIGCGNGLLEAGEECDDGNLTNFDGCSSTCQVEQSQRVDSLVLKYNTDATCAANALGGAVPSPFAQAELQSIITGQVKNGAISILLTVVGPTDSSGANDSDLIIGVMGGSPEQPAGSPAYNGTADLDWWYLPDANSVDSSGAPITQLPAPVANKVLTIGPGSLTLKLSLGNGAADVDLSNSTLIAPINKLSKPLESSNGLPPGHVADEHVSSALKTFESTGVADGGSAPGTLCGNISALSLARVALPSAVSSICTVQHFTASNTLLDLMVDGCSFGVPVLNPTQPDQVDSAQPAAGAGAPYTLSASSGPTVDTCKDKSGATVDLATCLAAAAYSSYFDFSTDRVIIRR